MPDVYHKPTDEMIENNTRMHNFNAGPSILPTEVYEQASQAIIDFNGSGLSVLEIGHRTPEFENVMQTARSLVRQLMELDDDHEVLFMHGGSSTQFMQIPMNLLGEKDTAAYADTGVWSTKAIKEARIFGNVEIACCSKDGNYNYIPKDFAVPNDAKYFYLTTNNTIYGTQWQKIPGVSVPLVADMCSDVLSRKVDFNSYALIHASAQKNIGPAGVNIVVVNKNILGKIKRQIPTIMDYRVHIREESMINTPPVFAVYVCMLTLQWLKGLGGLDEIEQRNKEKSDLLYSTLDNSSIFKPTAVKEDRSRMNVCFVMDDLELEKRFLEFAKSQNIYGLKGHRSVGGFRASLYNALPLASVEYLVDVMNEFERTN
jgi:phosphoserine aminotransferase